MGEGVLPRYARLLESPNTSRSRSRREAVAAARACFEALRFRFPGPDAAYLIDLLIQLGDIGSFDLHGSVRTIGTQIGELLAEPVDVARLSRGVRALCGRTCVVERVSRQLWCLRLAGASDPGSPHHRRLLAETPTPCRLGGVESGRRRNTTPEPRNAPVVGDADEGPGSPGAFAEIAAERDEAREGLIAAACPIDQTREVESARVEIEDLRRQLIDANVALAATVARSRQLEELLLEREVEREDLTRRLADLQMKLEQAQAREPVQVDAPGKEAALKCTLKLERARRHAAEVRLRRILGVLRTKLDALSPEAPEDALEGYDAEDLAPVIVGFGRVLLEHAADLRLEIKELERSPGSDAARIALLRQDAETAELLARHGAGDR
jgi:hypothetical protein